MNNKLLVAPLNWGLGHATRCIPLINEYLSKGWQVEIASDGDAQLLLKEEFPNLTHLELPAYNIQYAQASLMTLTLLKQLPKLRKAIELEKKWIDSYVEENQVDLIISDNRFGLYSDKCKCIFLTHQIHLQMPIGKTAVNKINQYYIKKFDECWVPDYEGESSLTGRLSSPVDGLNVKYIGPLSRFVRNETTIKYSVAAVISGPEPSRTFFEEKLIDQLKAIEGSILIRGIQVSNNTSKIGKLTLVDHLSQLELQRVFNESAIVVSRAGYSTIMDLHKLNRPAILVPTPGQQEQIYLSKHLSGMNQFHFLKESEVKQKLVGLLKEFTGKIV